MQTAPRRVLNEGSGQGLELVAMPSLLQGYMGLGVKYLLRVQRLSGSSGRGQ